MKPIVFLLACAAVGLVACDTDETARHSTATAAAGTPFSAIRLILVTDGSSLVTTVATGPAHLVGTDLSQKDDGSDVLPPVLWTLVGVGVVVVVGGALYLLKRQLGAFPEDPEWVAPIGGIHSRNLPDETTYAEGGGEPPAHH